jgi:hypothetical protein
LLAAGQSGIRVRPLGGNRAGEVRIGRFLRNPRVTSAEMLSVASERTAELVEARHVLVIQDTTTLRDDGDQASMRLHPAIAVDAADGALLGLTYASFLHRTQRRTVHHNQRAFEDKESCRWLNVTADAAKLAAAGAASVTVVMDREGDIYEEFACRPAEVEVVVRAKHDRLLLDGQRLFTCADQWPELGCDTIAIPAGPGRAARQAVVSLRSGLVTIKRPKRCYPAQAAKLPETVSVWFVEARETDPPPGTTPAHWRLLSTHPLTTLADAQRITRFYRQRWTIEELFRVMKTKGFDIEAVRMADTAPFENLTIATLIAAVQVLQMVRERDGIAGRPLQDILDPNEQPALEAICRSLEGKTAKQKNPHPCASLAYMAWVCARLGGWTGYYGKPGPVVMLQGMIRLETLRQGWHLRNVV